MTITDALQDSNLFASWFDDPSWDAWKVVLKSTFGIALGYTDLLSLQLPDDPKAKADLSQVQHLADRAAKLTAQLLLFSRQQAMAQTSLNLNAVIENTLEMLEPIIGEDIEFDWIPDPDLGTIRADESQLGQILMNLATNARDAMPTGGTLTIETSKVTLDHEYVKTLVGGVEPGTYVRWKITDTGAGMDAATQQKIFDPFFTTKEVGQGTGLGLSTIHGIVKEHGAHIQVESEPGQGTSFTIYWPTIDQAGQSVSDEKAEPLPRGSETILVVEDEVAVREMIELGLQSQGYRVIGAGSAEEAQELFRQSDRPIDLLLTDVVMPGQSGPDLYTQLEAESPGLRALFISGHAHKFDEKGELFRTPFLQKPFRVSDLAVRVREVLGKEQIN